MNAPIGFPEKHGLYDPDLEKDSCGVGFVAHIKGKPSHQIVSDALTILINMDHRGACGCEANTGDGAGILVGMPDKFVRRIALAEFGIDLPKIGQYSVGNIFHNLQMMLTSDLPHAMVNLELSRSLSQQHLDSLQTLSSANFI
jgi:glutamate synthase (NADPH) large chain